MHLVRRLPLVWKILLPFLALLLLLGSLGAFVILRDLSARAEAAVDEELLRRSLEAQSSLSARELYLLESANFAANVEGIAQAVKTGDGAAATQLLRSVLALKPDLGLVAVAPLGQPPLAALDREAAAADVGPQATALLDRAAAGERAAALFERADGTRAVGVATPVCGGGAAECAPVGAALVALGVQVLADGAGGPRASDAGVALFDDRGRQLATSGQIPSPPPPAGTFERVRDRSQRVADGDSATLYSPYLVQGQPTGVLAVTIPTGPAFAAARGAALRLALIFLGAMVGVTLLGALLSRYLVGHIRRLLDANRRLGAGDLEARVEVDTGDELGALADGFNLMATRLQESHTTLETRVEERTDEVRRLLEERTEFFTALSHQLRTPLAVILAEADMLSSEGARSTIKESAGQLVSVVNDILRIAEAESGAMEVELQELDLREVLREVRGTVDGLARSAGVTPTVRLPRALPPVIGDPVRLREVLVNLVDNATKYTPEGGRIRVTAAASNGHVAVSVSDTGLGVPPEVGDRIFEPFYRVKGTTPQRAQPSTGLGLAVTRRLVEAQGGGISYRSEPGEGTTFTFTLPVAPTATGHAAG